jgi:hypothetical protein
MKAAAKSRVGVAVLAYTSRASLSRLRPGVLPSKHPWQDIEASARRKRMKVSTILLLLLLPFEPSYAAKKPQFQLQVIKPIQTLNTTTYSVPGTPSRSDSNCTGTVTQSGANSTVNAGCNTTTTPGTEASVGTGYRYSEDIRVLLPGGSHVTLWCQEGFRTCLHLKTGTYWAERYKDNIWIYCAYADQELFDETGMSPGQRKANHQIVRVKYRVVGNW